MIVAKTFKWEAAHRLPRHEGKCKHIHGHSYKMTVEFEGEPNANGMVIDFNDIKKIIQPHIDNIDHSTMIAEGDDELKKSLTANHGDISCCLLTPQRRIYADFFWIKSF